MLPDGGSSGSERIWRGKDFAAESIKILARNRRLLWFSFLIFLIFVLSIGIDLCLQDIFGTNAFPGVMNVSALLWFALTFTAAFIVYFVFFSLAAGLVICVSQIPLENSISIREGLSRAWSYKRPIAGWTVIGALLWIPVGPFICGFYLITVFALPAIVLDNKDLVAAIRESVAIFWRVWVETYVSFGIVLLVSIGLVFVTLFSLGQVGYAYGLINGGNDINMIRSLVVNILMAVGVVVMGIATCILYTYEKTGVSLRQ